MSKMSKEIGEEYSSSLADLTVNSKPLINMLTILAEEYIDHAGVIVEAVEKHLEKVRPDIKLPVLYLVDSIIKNVSGAYTQKFSQIIVNMFTKTFKQVDEKTRAQMFKLRETWHDVFPPTKLYQLDVKVNLIDPAWPIQAQPQQSNIHVNPNFLKKPVASTSSASASSSLPVPAEEEEKMKSLLARKEQELLMLQRKKVEMELEQTKRQLELTEKTLKPTVPVATLDSTAPSAPTVNSVSVTSQSTIPPVGSHEMPLSVKQRLGPPVNQAKTVIAPVTGPILAMVRRDPRLVRHQAVQNVKGQPSIASNVFDIKPLARPERVIKRKNVITIDVRPDTINRNNYSENKVRDPRNRKDPRLERRIRSRDIDQKKFRDRDKRLTTKRQEDNERMGKQLQQINKGKDDLRERIPKLKPNNEIDKNSTTKLEEIENRIAKNQELPSKSNNDENDLKSATSQIISQFPVFDSKKISKLPPIPRVNSRQSDNPIRNIEKTDELQPSPTKKKKSNSSPKKKNRKSKDSSSSPSPDKRLKDLEVRERNKSKEKEQTMDIDIPEEPSEEEIIAFKELKNFHKERYMRRNKQSSESPEKTAPVISDSTSLKHVQDVPPTPISDAEATTVSMDVVSADVVVGNKDVDLRVLHSVAPEPTKAAIIAQKRPSTDALDNKPVKKNKLDKFDILFGSEDVDLRQLPHVEEMNVPPPPSISAIDVLEQPETSLPVDQMLSPLSSPKEKDWTELKDKSISLEEIKTVPSQLDLVRAKLAEATKSDKDRLGRPLRFNKVTGDRRRTISSEDADLRVNSNPEELNSENDKESIKIILTQAEEQFKGGNINQEQYNILMMQVFQLNERLKLKEAKQKESLEISKRKLLNATHATDEEVNARISPKPTSPLRKKNTFGDIDERIIPHQPINSIDSLIRENSIINVPKSQSDLIMPGAQDSDLRVPPIVSFAADIVQNKQMHPSNLIPGPPMPPFTPNMFMGPCPPMWRGNRPILDDYSMPRGIRPRIPNQPFYRNKFEKRMSFDNRPPFEPHVPMRSLPRPLLGMRQDESPVKPYERTKSPPLLGSDGGTGIPPTDYKLLEYVDQDPMKTIDIDGVPREIRYYGSTAIVMLEWDDPHEIKFMPGSRRITFDNKDSVVLGFNEEYTTVDIEDHVFRIRLGAPTRELYINDKWYECLFGGPPIGVVIDGKVKLIQIEGPIPNVDISKEKRVDLVAGKINLIVDAEHVCPIFLDAKLQKFSINNTFLTIRFVDSLRTVLINEKPYEVEFGGLPRPICIGKNKHFIRFSVLPRGVRPGHVEIANMEGKLLELKPATPVSVVVSNMDETEVDNDGGESKEVVENDTPAVSNTEEAENSNPGLDMLASLMPSSMAPASQFSGYNMAESAKIPGLETPADENPLPTTSLLGNINVTELFAKLVAKGIVQVPSEASRNVEEKGDEKAKEVTIEKSYKDDKHAITPVDLLKPETLRVKQKGLVSRIYGGMQCSGCGARFPPEHTVRYSQHLDWHFRQNRRERDSARRAHSRHWHYDLSDWVQYEEVEDLDEREKSWFESQGAEGDSTESTEGIEGEMPSVPAGAPTDQFCALCGDKFDQFYNEDKEEWHLRKAVRHEEKNYHPLCFEDYKASLNKEEPIEINESVAESISVEKIEPIEIKDVDDPNSQSDDESVVEVIEAESPKDDSQETLEIPDEGDEDDVVLKAEPVEEVVVDDDADTDDETQAERVERDKQAALDFSNIKVKQEPVDPDDEPVITAEEEAMKASADTTSKTVLSSIDGNFQLESANPIISVLPSGGIRINISKQPIPILVNKDNLDNITEDISMDDEPLPPGEEPELDYTIKETLKDVELSRQPPVQRGTELSGLCSIM